VRVVTAHADKDKCAMLAALSLKLAEQWWIREVQPARAVTPAGQVTGTGFSGLLGPAPPVYDPGGPVLLLSDLAGDADLAGVEREPPGLDRRLGLVPGPPPLRTRPSKGSKGGPRSSHLLVCTTTTCW
jgi:hypothetical protein